MKSIEERFWAKVKKTDGCWTWQGCLVGGRGQLRVEGKRVYAPRVAYELTHGKIEEGKYILHSCDNPICVNPKHLRVGDHSSNMIDMAQRGRTCGQKLTIEDVYKIRRLLKIGKTPREIALDLNCERTNIYHIKSGKSWSHI